MNRKRLNPRQRRELRELLQSTPELRLYRRALAILLLDEGTAADKIASWLGISRATVFGWQKRFLSLGHSRALVDRPGRGRPSQWDPSLIEALEHALAQPPLRRGSMATDWTVPLLCEHLRLVTGQPVSQTSLRRQLHRMGYRYKRPRYVLAPDPDREKKNDASVAA